MSILNTSPATVTASATVRLSYPWVKHTLAFSLAISLSYVAASALQHWRTPQPQLAPDSLASLLVNSTVNPAVLQPPRPLAQPRQQVVAPRLTTAVLVGDHLIDNPGQLALPSNSVFALSLQADHSGSADVYAINPEGRISHLWSGYLHAGQDLRTPTMRLQGLRGTETLRMVFKPDAVDGSTLSTVVHQLEILHE